MAQDDLLGITLPTWRALFQETSTVTMKSLPQVSPMKSLSFQDYLWSTATLTVACYESKICLKSVLSRPPHPAKVIIIITNSIFHKHCTLPKLKLFKSSLSRPLPPGENNTILLVSNGFSITGYLIFGERQAFAHSCELPQVWRKCFPCKFWYTIGCIGKCFIHNIMDNGWWYCQ